MNASRSRALVAARCVCLATSVFGTITLLTAPLLSRQSQPTAQEHLKPTNVIRREVLARNRHALVIYGGMHLQRKNLSFNYLEPGDGGVDTIVSSLERQAPTPAVFSIWTNTAVDLADLQNVRTWPIPSLALVRGTLLGAADFTFYYRFDDKRPAFANGTFVSIQRERVAANGRGQDPDAANVARCS